MKIYLVELCVKIKRVEFEDKIFVKSYKNEGERHC